MPVSCSYALEVSKVELLNPMDILRDMPEDRVAALRSPMRTTVKHTIFYVADVPEVCRVELYRQSPDGRKLTLAIVEQGTFFGEMSLIDLRLEGTYAMALEDCVICVLSRHDLESLILEHPTVARRGVTS